LVTEAINQNHTAGSQLSELLKYFNYFDLSYWSYDGCFKATSLWIEQLG